MDKPAPGPRDVLVRVRATAVNPVDWKLRSGGQRNVVRYRLPWILGLDVSGVVEAAGAEVTRSAPASACSSTRARAGSGASG